MVYTVHHAAESLQHSLLILPNIVCMVSESWVDREEALRRWIKEMEEIVVQQ